MSRTLPRWLTLMTLSVMLGHAWADDLQSRSEQQQAWEGLKARLAIGTASPRHELSTNDNEPLKVNSLSLMGDYYLGRPSMGMTGGWRATTGVVLGARSSVWGSPALMDRRVSGSSDTGADAPLAYLGVGYTSWSSKGWGLSADVGLLGGTRASIRGGRAGAPNLDDTVRDLRFAPTVQLGLSYSF